MKISDYKAAIFDLDGTIIDSMGMWSEIDVEYLGLRGIECPPELQRDVEGLSYEDTAVYFKKTFKLPESLDEIKAEWHQMSYYKYCHKTPLKPGIKEFLVYLKEKGLKCGVASSNNMELIHDVLKAHEIDSFFNAISTCDEVSAAKPNPAVYLKTAEKLNTAPRDCVVFEDVVNGLLAGASAGMGIIAIDDLYSASTEDKKRRIADAYIEDFRELIE